MELDESEWADKDSTVEELRDGRLPVVFAFRPTRYMRVAPAKLREWEEVFAENVGTRPDKALAQRWSEGYLTFSGSGSDWDDCDYW